MRQFKVGDKVKIPNDSANAWRLEYMEPNEILTIVEYDGDKACWVYSNKVEKIHHAFFDILEPAVLENKVGGELLE